ncbi:Nif3-like dinuclear metal center hexameric protein [Mycoplasma bradburyae]|uniref:Nif3-like dinuclear metal center hexameric protein n=1 Tax=Mycoplasma bradburyae TaxID=2963128 RepID=UPI0020CC1D06|nr:Nif3-like dinuclear metal center hexameric protein [Mycoplasma bradburyae]UTS71195.1 Nif3-like dinuclear metal center hexameric protein [Mycoplasma bradburyae]
MQIKKITNWILKLFPLKNQLAFDNAKLINHKNLKNELNKLLICADYDGYNFKLANKLNANLIISHHPMFIDSNDLKNDNFIRNAYDDFQKNNRSFLVLHTAYDFNEKGAHAYFFKLLNINKFNVTPINHYYEFEINSSLEELIESLKSIKYIDQVKYLSTSKFKKNLKKGLICLGSGYSSNQQDIDLFKQYDILITGDLKWSSWINAVNHHVNVIDIGHNVESIFIDHINELLVDQFKNELNKNQIILGHNQFDIIKK